MWSEPGRTTDTMFEGLENVLLGLPTSVKLRKNCADWFFTPSLRTLTLKSWTVWDHTTLLAPLVG